VLAVGGSMVDEQLIEADCRDQHRGAHQEQVHHEKEQADLVSHREWVPDDFRRRVNEQRRAVHERSRSREGEHHHRDQGHAAG
jgi:hypothetical protein